MELVLHSTILGEVIVLRLTGDEAAARSKYGLAVTVNLDAAVTYDEDELRRLRAFNPSVDELKTLHEAKKALGGTFVEDPGDPRNPAPTKTACKTCEEDFWLERDGQRVCGYCKATTRWVIPRDAERRKLFEVAARRNYPRVQVTDIARIRPTELSWKRALSVFRPVLVKIVAKKLRR